LIFKETLELYYFPLLLISSLIGCYLGTYLSKPTDEETLDSFYTNVNPWGFWKPVRERVMQNQLDFEPNKNFKSDLFNILIGIVWQTSIIVAPVFLVLMQWPQMIVALVIAIITSIILKKSWWNKLPNQ